MLWIKNKKNRYTPVDHSFLLYVKVGFKGVYTLHGFRDGIQYTVFVMVYMTGYSRQHSTIHVQFSTEPPRGGGSMPRWFAVLIRGGSNEYPQSMFWSKNKKNRYTPTYGTYHTHLYDTYSEILSIVTDLFNVEMCGKVRNNNNCLPCTLFYVVAGHFHVKLEKKFPDGAQKKYPCTEGIYDFSFCFYPKSHGKYFGIDFNSFA